MEPMSEAIRRFECEWEMRGKAINFAGMWYCETCGEKLRSVFGPVGCEKLKRQQVKEKKDRKKVAAIAMRHAHENAMRQARNNSDKLAKTKAKALSIQTMVVGIAKRQKKT